MSALADVLENDLRDRFRRGHNLVIWLDADGVYTSFVDRLAARDDFPGEVVAFRGSFLETLFALEGRGNGLDPERLVLHTPGHNDRTIRATPLLELYHAGHRYEKSFATLVRETASGAVEPDEIERFVDSAAADFDAAERWLESRKAGSRDGLAGYLEELEDDWIWLLKGLFDPRSHESRLRDRIAAEADGVAILSALLHRRTGMSDAFITFILGVEALGGLTLDELTRAFAAWLMSVEYVHDLRAEPRLGELGALKALSPPLVERCRELVARMREHLPEIYAELAGEVEARLADELDRVDPRALGRIDTFEKESDRMLAAAVDSLGRGRFAEILDWSSSRPADSFWLRRDLGRRNAWGFAESAARLGRALVEKARPLDGVPSLDEAVERYASEVWEVDREHRRFEQLRLRVLAQTLPHSDGLRKVTEKLRRQYRSWADALAASFAELCELHGYLPSAERQQRTFYDQVIQPRLGSEEETVVLFLVDALRFEMAKEVADELGAHGAEVRVEARLAELPTITPVGMNVLAPVARAARLQPRFDSRGRWAGFRTGEFTVSRPEDRLEAMRRRSFGTSAASSAALLDLSTVCDAPRRELDRRLKGARLVVVHSREIDETGETDTGLATFESWLQQLSNAFHRLKASGFGHFVFTADHGFLIQDATTADARRYGPSRRAPKPRWVLAPGAEQPAGCVSVPLASLGYDVEDREAHLILRRDTKVFETGSSATSFCHGGNSLQERVIPVLTAVYRASSRLRLERYRILAAGAPERRAGVYRLPLVVRPQEEAQSVLEIARDRELSVALDVVEASAAVDRRDVAPVIYDVEGGVERHGHWRAPVGEEFVVCFDLRGPRDARVRIRIYHPESEGRVEELSPETFFEVAGVSRREAEEAHEPEPRPALKKGEAPSWTAAFDEATARVFLHLERHGSITEEELSSLLGGPRPARRFARDFDGHVERVPFGVRVEVVGGVKRYVRGD